MSAFDRILDEIEPGTKLRTPDRSTGKPFLVETVDLEGVGVRTQRGGRIRVSLFAFDTAVKYLADHDCRGDRWLEVKDPDFQALLNMENDRVRAASYILGILGAARIIEIDGSRPNRVRLTDPVDRG